MNNNIGTIFSYPSSLVVDVHSPPLSLNDVTHNHTDYNNYQEQMGLIEKNGQKYESSDEMVGDHFFPSSNRLAHTGGDELNMVPGKTNNRNGEKKIESLNMLFKPGVELILLTMAPTLEVLVS
ncbi:hypothetical protein L2E82_14017 [Cichorium intybus]|uniref:Uncharacterized protein n=1 Tax=Cichorium intybus TaxID=13427 RepID=A0ACB9EYV2_CICIN|nr:hypothetical protein L2E82_14017 [Cichorium intybus]